MKKSVLSKRVQGAAFAPDAEPPLGADKARAVSRANPASQPVIVLTGSP